MMKFMSRILGKYKEIPEESEDKLFKRCMRLRPNTYDLSNAIEAYVNLLYGSYPTLYLSELTYNKIIEFKYEIDACKKYFKEELEYGIVIIE